MPTRNPELIKAKRRRNYDRRRAKIVEYLGGECAVCRGTENLEFDHVYPESKRFSIGEFITHSWDKIKVEIDKCQLLCRECHTIKNKLDAARRKWAERQRAS